MLKKHLSISWQKCYALTLLFIFCLYLLGELVPMRAADLQASYGLVLTAIAFGIYLSRRGISGPWEIKIYLLWMVWTLLSRWLNGDFYLFLEFDMLMTMLLGFMLFSVGTVLDRRERGLLLDAVSLLYALFAAAVAAVGIAVFITNTYIHIPPEDVWFTIRFDGAVFSPNFLSTSRLTSAPRFAMAFGLLLYQFQKRRSKVFRVFAVLALAVLYVAMALCHSRTVQLAVLAMAVMLAILAARSLFSARSARAVLAFSLLFALIAVPVCYKGFSVASSLVSGAHNIVAPALEERYNALESKPNPEYFGIGKSAEELVEIYQQTLLTPADTKSTSSQNSSAQSGISANDSRKVIGNWSFSKRVEIWSSGLVHLSRSPSDALKGMLSRDVAPAVNKVINELYPYIKDFKINMHNSYLQVLMVTGIPGFLLIALWVILLVKDMVKLYFFKRQLSPEKLLTLPMAAFFVICLSEVMCFAWLDLSSMAFYLMAGAFLGYYHECFPPKKAEL